MKVDWAVVGVWTIAVPMVPEPEGGNISVKDVDLLYPPVMVVYGPVKVPGPVVGVSIYTVTREPVPEGGRVTVTGVDPPFPSAIVV